MALDGSADRDVDRLVELIASADETVALTGAGVSTASGIPDFRGPNGIWNRAFDPDAFHRRRFDADPGGFWTDRLALRDLMFDGTVTPNAAHRALVELEAAGHLSGVITQNTDGLHAAAGAESVVELHGNGNRVVCEGCGDRRPADPVFDRVERGERPPRCAACDGILKPDVVLFGEPLPHEGHERARMLSATASAFLAIGTSLLVEPAASLPARALDGEASLGIVNLDPTPYDDRAAVVLHEDVTTVLPAVVERIG